MAQTQEPHPVKNPTQVGSQTTPSLPEFVTFELFSAVFDDDQRCSRGGGAWLDGPHSGPYVCDVETVTFDALLLPPAAIQQGVAAARNILLDLAGKPMRDFVCLSLTRLLFLPGPELS